MMKKILSMVISLTMAAMLSITALAADSNGLYTDMTKVGFSKILKVADGVDISGVNKFTFQFTGVNTQGTPAAKADQVFKNLNGGSNEITITVGQQLGGVAYGSISFAEIFKDVSNFPNAGEYVYTVKETTLGYDDKPETANITEKLTVDQREYTVHIYIVNEGSTIKYKGVTVEYGGTKIDPTITIREDPEDPTKTLDISGANFINYYKEDVQGKDGQAVLTVIKSVTGDYADKTKTFPIYVNFTIPSTASQRDVSVNSTDSISWSDEKNGSFYANLSDGGKIEFTKLPVGTTFTVSETQDMYYKSKITGFVLNEDTTLVSGPRINIQGKAPITGSNNIVYIENNRTDIIPTGLVIDNLPYIALVIMAGTGLVFFAVKKKARAN